MHLGGRIVIARQARNLNQKALADLVEGLSQQALSNLEQRDSATSEFAIRIADALRVSIRWLLDGQGDMNDADWPFPDVDRARWERLEEDDRKFVQRWMNNAIKECEDLAAAVAEEAASAQSRSAPSGIARVVHEPHRPQHPARSPQTTAANVTNLDVPPSDSTLVKTRAQKDRTRHLTQRKRVRT